MTEAAFANALALDMALGGSTNSLLHLPAIAHEAGLTLDLETASTDQRPDAQPLPLEPERPSLLWKTWTPPAAFRRS